MNFKDYLMFLMSSYPGQGHLFSGKKNGCINGYALMIEDKTNTSEHSRQIERYKTVLAKDFPNRIGYSSYIKTGIMYDGDWLMTHNVNAVIDLNMLLAVIQPFRGKCSSEILDSFCTYLGLSIAFGDSNI
jgi:hypothetical protein